MKILSFARLWGLPWWEENVSNQIDPAWQGKNARETTWAT